MKLHSNIPWAFLKSEWQETGGTSTDAGGGPSASEERPPELRGTVVPRHRSEEDDQKNSQEQRGLHRPDRSLEQLGLFPRSKDMCTIPSRRAIWFDLIDPAANQWNTTQMAKNKSTADFMLLRRLLGWGINESFWSFSSAFWESKKLPRLASPPLLRIPPLPSPPSPLVLLVFYA